MTNPINYWSRKRGMRTRWQFKRDIGKTTKGLLLLLCWLVMIATIVMYFSEAKAANDRAASIPTIKQKLFDTAGILAHCMNGKGFYDRISGTMFFCEKVITVKYEGIHNVQR